MMYAERSSNDSLLDGFNVTSFFNSSQPVGEDFKDPILVSTIAVNGLCAVSFAIMAIAAHWIKDKKKPGRFMFGVLAGLLGAMFLIFVDATGLDIANELAASISFISVVLKLVGNTISNTSDVTLIFVVYGVIANRLDRVHQDFRKSTKLRMIHLFMSLGTAILGLADAALGDYAQILTSNADVDDDDELSAWVKIVQQYSKVHLTYTSVYCFVTLEMLFWATFIFRQSKRTQIKSRISMCLALFVTPFLVIRSAAALALGILYIYLGRDQPKYTGLIEAALLGVTAVIIYFGLVFIGFQKEWYPEESYTSEVRMQQDGSGSAFSASHYNGQNKGPTTSTTQLDIFEKVAYRILKCS